MSPQLGGRGRKTRSLRLASATKGIQSQLRIETLSQKRVWGFVFCFFGFFVFVFLFQMHSTAGG